MQPRLLAATAALAWCAACAHTWGDPIPVVPTRATNPLVQPGTLRGVWGGGECTVAITESFELEITRATLCVSRVECVTEFGGGSDPPAPLREERVTLGAEHAYRLITLQPLSREEAGRGCEPGAPREAGSRSFRATWRGCTENGGLVTARSTELNLYLGENPAKELRVVAWIFAAPR